MRAFLVVSSCVTRRKTGQSSKSIFEGLIFVKQADSVERLVAAIRSHPDVDEFLTRPDHYAGSGADFAVARSFVEWRNNLQRVADEVEAGRNG